MIVKNHRVDVEKKRKELKSDALAWGKAVDSEAKRIFALLQPIESHLQNEEDKITKEKERIQAKVDRIEKEKIQARVDSLLKYNIVLPFMDIATWSDDEYNEKLSEVKTVFEAKQKRIANEKAEREAAEAEFAFKQAELARMQAEQERQARVQAEREAALRHEREAIEREKQEVVEAKARAKFEIKVKEEARIQAEKDAKARVIQEADEKKRVEALKPDKEKLISNANNLLIYMFTPVESEQANVILDHAHRKLNDIAQWIIEQAKEM